MYFDSTFYIVPNALASQPTLCCSALARSGLAGVTQMTMHSRESFVILRAGGRGIVAHTLFYAAEDSA